LKIPTLKILSFGYLAYHANRCPHTSFEPA
jgi:hypothetical protein